MPWLTVNSSKKKQLNRSSTYLNSIYFSRIGGKLRLLSVLIISLLSLTACSLFPEEAIEEVVPVVAPAVKTQKAEYVVKRDTIEKSVRANGRLTAQKEESLYFSEANFPIAQINVEVGQRVTKGDILVSLDTKDIAYQIKDSEFDLKLAELNMIEMLREEEAKDNSIELEKAKMNFEKMKLAHQQLVEKSTNSILVAPFNGEVIAVNKKVGDTIEAYKTIIVLADTSGLKVNVTVSNTDLKEVALGMPATLKINGNDLEGEVISLPQEETDNQNPNQEKFITLGVDKLPSDASRGTFVDARIIILRKENVLTIQGAALRSYNGRHYVQVKDDKGRRDVDIEIGIQTPTQIEVVVGLEEGQILIGR